MWVQFKDFVPYRAYRLNNMRADVHDSDMKRIRKNVRRIKILIPSSGSVDCTELIAPLKFFRGPQEGFDTFLAPENTVVRNLAYFLCGDAKNFYESRNQTITQRSGGSTPSELAWTRMVHAIISRYLTHDHLRVAYESVTREQRRPQKYEGPFA